MRINNVVRVTNGNIGRNIAFSRAPKKGREEKEYTKTIQEAYRYLGIQNRAMILHGTSFPNANPPFDTKIGTPYGADEFVEFAKLHGFNAVQLGPNGKLNRGDTSPYTSSVFEKNPLFINPVQLMDREYASIVNAKELKNIEEEEKSSRNNYTRTDFNKSKEIINKVLDVAFNNFEEKLLSRDSEAVRLNKEFEEFQKNNSYWLDYYSVLNVLGEKYNTDYYPYWSNDDRELIGQVKKGNKDAISRYNEIQYNNKKEIDKYKFTQFLVDKQARIDGIRRNDFTYISDLEVGASSLDELVFQDVFLPDYKIGCKYGGPMNSPQLWGIAMPDPNKLFNKDGSLGPSGQFLKAKLKNALQGAQGLRIDHAMGLVNPYIYNPNTIQYTKKEDKNGNMVEFPDRTKLKAGYLSETGIDKHHNYEKVLSRIILPTMQEMGVNPHDVVWEDLGQDETGVFNKIYRQHHHLPGISGLIWTKGNEAPKENWAYIGCHDNKSGKRMILDGDIAKRDAWKPHYLAEALRCDPYKGKEREELHQKIKSSPLELWKAKLADLFHSTRNIQVSFTDFFGIDKSYNTPGTSGGDNWTLRLNSDYKDSYYKSLEEKNGWAINIPEVLATAVQAKFDEDVSRNHYPYWETLDRINPLINNLNHWSNVLKEKE